MLAIETDAPLALALAVINERMARLSDEDRAMLIELLPALFGDDEEERESAVRAAGEIVSPPLGRLMRLPDGDLPRVIGARIRDARERAGLTQGELSEATQIPQSHISQLENGKHWPTSVTRNTIAKALGLDPDTMQPSKKTTRKGKRR